MSSRKAPLESESQELAGGQKEQPAIEKKELAVRDEWHKRGGNTMALSRGTKAPKKRAEVPGRVGRRGGHETLEYSGT